MSFTLLGILNSQAAGAGGAGAYDLLETTVLTSSASSVSFTGLDSYTDYKHLQVRYVAQYTSGTTGTTAVNLRLNGDSGSNYSRHYLRGYSTGGGSGVDSTATTSTSNIQLNDAGTRPSETNNFAPGVVDILDFASATKNTTVRALHGANTPSESYIYLTSGAYLSTSAITQMQFFSISGFSYSVGTRFSLYGVKGTA